MEQLEFFDVPSPCVRVCTTDEKGYCLGCMRNRQERFGWLEMTSAEKLHVIKLCQRRYWRKKQAEKQLKVTLRPVDSVAPSGLGDGEDDKQTELF